MPLSESHSLASWVLEGLALLAGAWVGRESDFCHTEKAGSKVKDQEPDLEPLG